ncbi:hypothetical protein M441DRAFT_441931 [Trichoderma asperellum CBS 433.97]|uniref:Transmembrane protein n=1 Tax=Trichoderma asperellum (strain ATCC 204424 / CBS 433.97 / NBRC 101777) TaxID=1042311 RepID=A0A2T3Z4I0_TRIA4|nr:hypothetical protein M441DRAFT_441931 [Trichoderma asperellum CBS 433.97]PTB39660.1 hypothetical protein M441DRAFT_441931 [Trichoderma asperellum CBS 433.97]
MQGWEEQKNQLLAQKPPVDDQCSNGGDLVIQRFQFRGWTKTGFGIQTQPREKKEVDQRKARVFFLSLSLFLFFFSFLFFFFFLAHPLLPLSFLSRPCKN